jgi:hypothetical protein
MMAALGLAVAVLFALDVWGTYTFLTTRVPGANDFFIPWSGARAYVLHGLNPYSEEVGLQIQIGVFGRPAQPGEDLSVFIYPFYTIFLLAPLTVLPYAWAVAIWQAFLQFSLVAALLLLLNLYHWQPAPGVMALLALWAILFYPHARGLLLGQLVIVVFLFLVLALWALTRGYDRLAGVALALTTIKPQVIFLVIPLLLLWAIGQRRWRFVGAFSLMLMVLLGAAFLALPTWLGDFIRRASAYPAYNPPSAPWVLVHFTFPTLGLAGEIALALILISGLAWAWWREARSGWASFHWTLALTFLVTNLIVPHTATTNYLVFLVPLVPLYHRLYRRTGILGLAAVQGALLVGLWALFLATVDGRQEDAIMFLPLPLFMGVALCWGRRVLAQPLGDQR